MGLTAFSVSSMMGSQMRQRRSGRFVLLNAIVWIKSWSPSPAKRGQQGLDRIVCHENAAILPKPARLAALGRRHRIKHVRYHAPPAGRCMCSQSLGIAQVEPFVMGHDIAQQRSQRGREPNNLRTCRGRSGIWWYSSGANGPRLFKSVGVTEETAAKPALRVRISVLPVDAAQLAVKCGLSRIKTTHGRHV